MQHLRHRSRSACAAASCARECSRLKSKVAGCGTTQTATCVYQRRYCRRERASLKPVVRGPARQAREHGFGVHGHVTTIVYADGQTLTAGVRYHRRVVGADLTAESLHGCRAVHQARLHVPAMHDWPRHHHPKPRWSNVRRAPREPLLMASASTTRRWNAATGCCRYPVVGGAPDGSDHLATLDFRPEKLNSSESRAAMGLFSSIASGSPSAAKRSMIGPPG